MTVSYIFNR